MCSLVVGDCPRPFLLRGADWRFCEKVIAFLHRLGSIVGEAKTTERTSRAPVFFFFGETDASNDRRIDTLRFVSDRRRRTRGDAVGLDPHDSPVRLGRPRATTGQARRLHALAARRDRSLDRRRLPAAVGLEMEVTITDTLQVTGDVARQDDRTVVRLRNLARRSRFCLRASTRNVSN